MGRIAWSEDDAGVRGSARAALGGDDEVPPPMPTRLRSTLHASTLLAAIVLVAPGCAKRLPAIELPDAPLGRVIVYRNGVAYFERHASVEGELTLSVPAARVDDFLKSLTVVDTKTGDSLPLSYPTVSTGRSGSVNMTITIPKGRRDVRIAYVTESPAWKPSYRVMLDERPSDGGKAGGELDARLQAWAIVDNVSDEAWRRVAVGVGSTSALSFRYDLHSVQTVQRETIDTGTALAAAPPSGGSPYAVGGANVRVFADLGAESIDALERTEGAGRDSAGIALAGAPDDLQREFTSVVESNQAAPRKSLGHRSGAGRKSKAAAQVVDVAPPSPPPPAALDDVATQLAGNAVRIRVEGWAAETDGDREVAGLRRANTLRDSLVARGIAPDRIEVVGHADVASPDKLVRIVEAEAHELPSQARAAVDDDAVLGDAQFMTDKPMTIEAGYSGMVTLFDTPTSGERVFLFDPISERGSQRYAFNAVRVVNPTDNTLDAGPITVYAGKAFLGEGLTEPIPPRAAALVPYGLDRSMAVEREVETHEEIEAFRTIERGVATTETQRIRTIALSVSNRGHAPARVFVRHRVESGWALRGAPEGLERLGTDLLIPLDVAAGKTATLSLVESTPIATTIDLRTAEGALAVTRYLEHHPEADALRTALRAIVAAQQDLDAVAETLVTRRALAEALRSRVDELTVQLLALRKVDRAKRLSTHLAKRMRELGDRRDAVAAEISDLETRALERRIEVDGMIADLSYAAAKPEPGTPTKVLTQRSRTDTPRVARTAAGAAR